MNRLKLDFTLESAQERLNFINSYLVGFDSLTNSEAETIADYLLWGKDQTGRAIGAETELKSTWSKTNEPESLDAILEDPALSHAKLYPLSQATRYKAPRIVFDRAHCRKTCPPYLLPYFEDLWRSIDRLDLEICTYELSCGKRIKPPRDSLVAKFSEEERSEIERKAAELNQYAYLKKRRQLIELRREQFALQDTYKATLNIAQTIYSPSNNSVTFDSDVDVLPLGLTNTKAGALIFREDFDPLDLNGRQLKLISRLIWEKERASGRKIDFRDRENVYQIYLFLEELDDQGEKDRENHNTETNQLALLDTLNFYERIADLTDIQREVLDLKKKKLKNQEIADRINGKFGKSYTANYISTIFKQKIIGKINEAVKLHEDTVKNCFFPENYKVCAHCGKTLLLDRRNWVRKARSIDGFQNKCKKCEREIRRKNREERELKKIFYSQSADPNLGLKGGD